MSEVGPSGDQYTDVDVIRRLFAGERLRVGRELRALSQTEVGDAGGVTAAAISQFEHGDAKPSTETLERIAQALDVPIGFFAVGPSDIDLTTPAFFRSLHSAPASERKRARALSLVVRWLALALERWVRLPNLDVPKIPVSKDTGQDDVEHTAASIRKQWQLKPGPVDHAVRLLERHGIVVTRFEVGTHEMDAFSVPFPDRPVVVLGADKGDRARSRFDALHELGHLVMHDPDDRVDKVAEQQAHWFAAAFLMPAQDIVDALPSKLDVRHLVSLKGEWGTSMAALLRRARDLRVMDQRPYVSAMKALSAHGWRTREPGDLGPPEMPVLLQRALELVEEQGITLREVAKEARLPIDDVRHILGASRDPRPGVAL